MGHDLSVAAAAVVGVRQPGARRGPEAPRVRVFLAEDDVEMRRMLAGALRRDGHLVLEADTGATLLAALARAFTGARLPAASVIVSDVRMPGLDGLAVLRALRGHPWCPPVIMITGFGDAKLHEEALRLGAAAVLDKPFEVDALRAEVERLGQARDADP